MVPNALRGLWHYDYFIKMILQTNHKVYKLVFVKIPLWLKKNISNLRKKHF